MVLSFSSSSFYSCVQFVGSYPLPPLSLCSLQPIPESLINTNDPSVSRYTYAIRILYISFLVVAGDLCKSSLARVKVFQPQGGDKSWCR